MYILKVGKLINKIYLDMKQQIQALTKELERVDDTKEMKEY